MSVRALARRYGSVLIAEIRTAEGKLRLFVALDRTSKFAFVRLVESAGKMEAAQFLRAFIEAKLIKLEEQSAALSHALLFR